MLLLRLEQCRQVKRLLGCPPKEVPTQQAVGLVAVPVPLPAVARERRARRLRRHVAAAAQLRSEGLVRVLHALVEHRVDLSGVLAPDTG